MFRTFNPIPYMPPVLIGELEMLTNSEIDSQLWSDDPDMDLLARDLRDNELILDLTGNLDSCA
jgi:hypothetical protein